MAGLKFCTGCDSTPKLIVQEGENHLPYWYQCENPKCNIEIYTERGKTPCIARQFWNLAVKLHKLREINS